MVIAYRRRGTLTWILTAAVTVLLIQRDTMRRESPVRFHFHTPEVAS